MRHPHHIDDALIAVIVLAVAICLESFSLHTAIGESRHLKGGDTWVGFIRHSKIPELPVVLLEDVAALIGLTLAFGGVGLAVLTGDGVWDGIGTCAIGALLISVAVVLVIETKSLAAFGESAAPVQVAAIESALLGEGVDRIIHLRTMHLGPDELLVGAKVAMAASMSLSDAAAAIDAAEARIRAVVPSARVIYLEPDIDREGTASEKGRTARRRGPQLRVGVHHRDPEHARVDLIDGRPAAEGSGSALYPDDLRRPFLL